MTATTTNLPPIYVISLARAAARREKMRAQLQTLGAGYEIVDAVDGAALNPADYAHQLRQDKFRRKFGRDMLAGEIGCYLSHYRLWQRIVAEKTPSALILEDDAEWDDDLLPVICAIAELRRRWGVVLLSGRKHKTAGRLLATINENRQLILRNRREATTAGYMISQQGARELLEYCQEITAPIDFAYGEWWRNGIPFYCVLPPPVRQADAHSLIHANAVLTKASLPERIAASIWRKYDRWHARWRVFINMAQRARGMYDEDDNRPRWKYAYTDALGFIKAKIAKITGKRQVVRFRHPLAKAPLYLRMPSTDVIMFKTIFMWREYANLPLPETASVIIDAGANIGMASAFFASRYPNATVVALEPGADNFLMLNKNTAPYANAKTEHAALWCEETNLRLSDPGRGEVGLVVGKSGGGELVPAVTVDGIIKKYGIDRVSILKVDIEGSELEVFSNCSAWLERVDMVIVETHDRFKPNCADTVSTVLIKDFRHVRCCGENDCYIRRSLPTK
ncbi:MAG: FkbM family methyltransferase [Gammaproteobacteria bacterium]